MQRRFAELRITGLDDLTRVLPFGENKQVTFLRSHIATGLIFLRRSEPPRRQERSGGERRQKKRTSRLLRTLHLSSRAPLRTSIPVMSTQTSADRSVACQTYCRMR